MRYARRVDEYVDIFLFFLQYIPPYQPLPPPVTSERIGTNFLLPNIVPELDIAYIPCNHPVWSARQGFLCSSKPLCVTGNEYDGCTGCCEGLRDAQADPTGTAGYECMFAEKGQGGDGGGVGVEEAWEEFQGKAGDSGSEKHGWLYWDMELLERRAMISAAGIEEASGG